MSNDEKALMVGAAMRYFDPFDPIRVERVWGVGSRLIGNLICGYHHFVTTYPNERNLVTEVFDTLDGTTVEADMSFSEELGIQGYPMVEILAYRSDN
jgi:hypothetical protein